MWYMFMSVDVVSRSKWNSALHIPVTSDISLLSFLLLVPFPPRPPRCPSADYVYFENSSSNPLLIRRIEELNKVSVCMLALSMERLLF